jgi:hypothetical protein
MDKKNLEINQPVSAGRRESKNRKFLFFLFLEIILNINYLFLDSRRPAETGLVSFLDLPSCENVQKVQK